MANDINIVVSAQVGDATKGLQQVQQQVQRVDRQIKNSTKVLAANANQFNSTAVATNKWAKGALQQAGYQVGDFAVQLGGGQNALQAFGQQGSQLLGIFGPIGAVLGAGVAIVAAVGVAFQKTAKAAKEAAGGVEDFTDAITKSKSASVAAMSAIEAAAESNIENARKKFADFDGDLKGFLETMARLRRDQSLTAASLAATAFFEEQDALQSLRGEYSSFIKEQASYAAAVRSAQSDRENIIKQYELEISALESLAQAQDQFSAVSTLQQLDVLRKELEAIRINSIEPFMSSLSIPKDVIQNLLIFENAIRDAFAGGNIEGAVVVLGQMRRIVETLPEPIRQQMLPALLEMEGAARQAGATLEAGFSDAAVAAETLRSKMTQIKNLMARQAADDEVILDPRDPRYNKVAVIMAGLYSDAEDVGEAATIAGNKSAAAVNKAANAVKMNLSPSFQRLQDIQSTVSNSLERGLMAMVDGTMTVKDAFKSMATDIIKELYRIFVVKQITGLITNAIGIGSGVGMTAAPAVNPLAGMSGAQMLPKRAMGGQVTGGKAYMVGERGPEMIVPQRNGNVVPNNQLGAGGVTVNQTINVSTGVQQTVRTEIKTLMPQIANAAKAAVADAKLRGGSYGRSFA